jgi:hypothetical protein
VYKFILKPLPHVCWELPEQGIEQSPALAGAPPFCS